MRWIRRPSIPETLRDLARRRPVEAEEYLDTHGDEWEALAESNPHNAADILEAISEEEAAVLLTDLDLDDAGDVLDEMRPEAAADVIEQLAPGQAAPLIGEMNADQAADMIAALDVDARLAVMQALDDDFRTEVQALLHYPSDSAGGLMTTEFATLPIGITAGEAIDSLRRLHDELGNNLIYVYVTDAQGHLAGVVSFRDLFFARPGEGIENVMVHEPIAVHVLTDREDVSELIQRFHLLALPVLNESGRLVGIVKMSEALEAVQEEATEDIAQMVGAGAEETVLTPVLVSIRRRQPWLLVNLLIGIAIALAIAPFEDTIAEHSTLALLMPMVALLGGNSGAQSLAVVIRAMALGDLPPGRARRAIRREVSVGMLNAVSLGLLAGVAAGVLSGSWRVAFVTSFAVFVNLIVAGLAGAGIPVVLRRLNQDPALASNIFLTMVTDLVGFTGFLLTASLLL